MEWLGLHFVDKLPDEGQLLLECSHNPLLVMLAYMVACAAAFATLDMAERVGHVEKPAQQRLWRWVGACCLAGGIWAMHFIGMLAFQTPIQVSYDLPTTMISLLIALFASFLAMHTLGRPQLRPLQTVRAALSMGLGIAGLSVLIAIGASLAALLLARHFRSGSGTFHQLLKYSASLVMGAGIVSMHLTGMWSLSLVLPAGTSLPSAVENNHLQLGMTIALIALLIIGSSISAALADKKLQYKEQDLRRVNALLSQLDQARMSSTAAVSTRSSPNG